ncbi:MAG: MBL fold metallo-hydrolase, partial [Candidatus Velthaea sp.]
MADPKRRLATNVPGDWYVDATCIDCDACRQIAPATFAESGQYSCVRRQPADDDERSAAARALVACPVGAIGAHAGPSLAAAAAAFPLHVDGPVSYCGFNARASYGANSYLLEHAGGNWLIDSPRYNSTLVRALERHGGLRYIFLPHRDDVADAARFASHFGAERIIHRADRGAAPDAEIIIHGTAPVRLGPCTVVPTPGHTRGHCALHFERYLFSGDHLAWDRRHRRLDANRDVCWFDWPTQLASVARLRDFDFEWLLPGHGQ